MSKKLVAAQIGCGAFAQDQHGPNAVRNPNIAKIKWACDTNKETAKTYANKFSVENVTSSLEEVTTDPEVDFICIATSHEAHVPIIESAAKNGKHVFCEKPMAIDDLQAYKIMRAVRKSGIKLCVDYMRRVAPATVALKREWLAHKNNPKRQPWRVVTTNREKFLEEKVTDLIVRVQDESSTYRTVHLDPVYGGGLIIGEGVHWLDLACWLYEDDIPVEIHAWGSARMKYGVYMTFRSGNTVTLISTPNGTFDYPKELFEIACDGALFRMKYWVENQYFGRPGIEKEVFPMQRDPLPEVGKEGGFSGYMKKYDQWMRNAKNPLENRMQIWPSHGWEEMFDAFVDSVINNKPTPCDELAGYRATLLGHLAMRSIELNKPLPIPVDKWDCHLEL